MCKCVANLATVTRASSKNKYMEYKRIRHGFLITVKQWDNKINVKNLATGKIVTKKFSDHITAVTLAKQL